VLGRTQLALNAFGRSLSSEQFNVNFVGADSRQRNATRIGGGAVQLSGKLPLGVRELRWLAGADADDEHVAVRIFAVRAGSPDSLTESVRTNQVNVGAFAGANVEIAPRLTATLAARYDWIRVPFEDLIDSTQNGLHIFRRLSPRGGLTWNNGGGHELFGSVSRGFRAPAVVELGCADPQAACPLPFALGPDPALKPVIATTYELGWHFRPARGRLDASADAYRTDVRDDIFFIASTVTGGYFQNIGATRRSGVELALQWRGPAGLRAYANYGFTRATFETTATLATTRNPAGETVTPGDALPMVPEHRVNAGLAVPILRPQGTESGVALLAGVDARYVGRQWLRGDEENVTRRLSDYAVADLSLTLSWRDFELRGAVRNLFDRRVFTFGTFAENRTAPGSPVQRWLTPGLPRHLQVSVSRDF
jgi:outer membrane receptor protein involved in Fe transport